jgi:hypothetical protein
MSKDLSPLEILSVGYQQKKVGTQSASLRRILDAATHVQNNPDETTRTTRSMHRRASRCMDADNGNF